MTAPHDDLRDPQLSALLRATVDAPPLRAGFHDELEARMGTARVDRRRRRVTDVPARPRRLTPRRLLAATAVVAAAAVFAFAVLPALRGADTATATDVLAAMTASSGGAQTVRMHVITKTMATRDESGKPSDRSVDTADLTMDIAGDSLAAVDSSWGWKQDDGRWTDHSSSAVACYDETLHEVRSSSSTRDGWTLRRPAWQTDGAPIGDFTEWYSSLAAQVRAALAETDPSLPVQETTQLGRPAWRCTFTVHERWGLNEVPVTLRWDATVDQTTGLLVAGSVKIDSDGTEAPWTWELRVTSLETDPALEPDWQRPDVTGTKLTMVDEGTRFGTPEEVARRSWPTLPLIPQWAPAGYRRTDVASAGFAPSVGSMQWSVREGDSRLAGKKGDVTLRRVEWPLPGQAVLVRFRRGFSSFTVQVTPKPFGMGNGGTPDITLTSGSLQGKPAFFGTDASDGTQIGISMPTLIAYSDRSRIVISGDLTRDELVQVANSMKTYGDVDKPLMPGYGD